MKEASQRGRSFASRRFAALVGIATLLAPPNAATVWAGPPFSAFINPAGGAAAGFGTHVVALSTGHVVVTAPLDDTAAADAGAVYLFNGATGALISTITGTKANDQVGSGGVTALNNGDFVILSPLADDGAVVDAGAVTWGSGTTGVSGTVSSANSLVGSRANDFNGASIVESTSVPSFNPTAQPTRNFLTNSNYLVVAPNWGNLTVPDVGALALGSGTVGLVGVVSATNSLIGGKTGDMAGVDVRILTGNGNYVVATPQWDTASLADVGAVTWGNGATGALGAISASKSLVGSIANDMVGDIGVALLTNGHYVVMSSKWDAVALADVGAATWGNGTTGIVGTIAATNSLVGSRALDQVSSHGVTALSNGNYVVRSPFWDDGVVADVGAATWGTGATGISGTITATNSLIGSTVNDQVGLSGVTALTNGNYVVASTLWNRAAVVDAGAATWGDGASGVKGVVSDTNSLVGSQTNDQVGGVSALSNGNYVVTSNLWANGPATVAGAVTWGSGTTGITGSVSPANSLVGTLINDEVGRNGVVSLTNGNYVVVSALWDNGATVDAGAATFGLGTGGSVGPVSASNSLVGSQTNDRVGVDGVTRLVNGNYVVRSGDWRNGAVATTGAATFGSGVTGISGPATAANSLVGSTAGDTVSRSGVVALSNGNYVVRSGAWDTSGLVDAGAVTWGSGATGISGVVSAANSLVGTAANDTVGSSVTALSNGNYVVTISTWDSLSVDAGAVVWGNGATGSNSNATPISTTSLIGGSANSGLQAVVTDDVNGAYFARFLNNGTVRLGSQTDGLAPTLAAVTASNVTATGADLGGNVTATNGSSITQRGFVYATTAANPDPRIGGTGVTGSLLSGATGVMTSTVGGLTAVTSYSFRAYAMNASGTAYSAVATFSTVTAPMVGSPTSTGITGTAATLGGDVTSDGGAAITERGVVYSLTSANANPLIGGAGVTRSVVSGTTGLFTSSVTGLTPVSGYSYRAYATNVKGTSYTAAATFTTIAAAPDAPTIGAATGGNGTVSVAFTAPANNGGSAITGYTATCGARTGTGTASPITVSGLTNGTAVTCTVVATNAVGNSAASGASNSVTPNFTGTAIPRMVNISTRGVVGTGDSIMIGGFIVGSGTPKKVIIKGRGPSMATLGVPGTLADPAIRLFSGATPIDFNDDWQSASNVTEITASGQAPTNTKESAILTTVNPGVPYTIHLTGVGETSGIAIVEVFELDKPEVPLLNLSTRGPVLTGDQVMIGGFIIQGDAAQQVLIVAKGPSLGGTPFNVPGALADPTLELYQAGVPAPIETNDNWGSSANLAAIQASGNAPTNPLESAIIRTLAPGAYTAIVKGVGAFQGIGLVEVYKK